jgi:Rhodopirellula transposase DDE domain
VQSQPRIYEAPLMKKENIKSGPKPLSPYVAEIEKFIKETYLTLSEKDRRAYAAIEALKLPRGGKAYIIELLGCSKNTLQRGISEILKPDMVVKNRIRKKGAGRKPVIEIIENIDEVFLKVIDDHIAGDPMDERIRWTNLSHKKIAVKMKEAEIIISVTVVKKLLKKHGFTKRKAFKNKPIGTSKNRNEQFEKINQLKEQYLKDGNPVVSMDTKKKSF